METTLLARPMTNTKPGRIGLPFEGIAHKLPDMTGVPGWDVSAAE